LGCFYTLDSWKRDLDFEVDKSASFAKPLPQKQLEEWLSQLQKMQNIGSEDEDSYAQLEKDIVELKMKWTVKREEGIQRTRWKGLPSTMRKRYERMKKWGEPRHTPLRKEARSVN
jgi:hypothetical protein